VRARRFVGAGYELVDASSQYDLVLHRDVCGAVARQFWGDRLYGKHPAGIRITLINPEAPPECAIICKSCPGQPTIARHLAPIRLSNDWRGDCHARSLSASYGDEQGATIWVGCTYDSGDALGVQTDPEECFVTIAAPGPYLTDLLVSATKCSSAVRQSSHLLWSDAPSPLSLLTTKACESFQYAYLRGWPHTVFHSGHLLTTIPNHGS
jgi:hypothetical protein